VGISALGGESPARSSRFSARVSGCVAAGMKVFLLAVARRLYNFAGSRRGLCPKSAHRHQQGGFVPLGGFGVRAVACRPSMVFTSPPCRDEPADGGQAALISPLSFFSPTEDTVATPAPRGSSPQYGGRAQRFASLSFASGVQRRDRKHAFFA